MRVAVALSGGIDSAVAALLLKRAGHQVHGVFMQNWDARIEDYDDEHPACTVESDYHDACRVADRLGIELSRVNFVRPYWNNVFSYALEAYLAGRTPNPDLLCNREIKMGRLWEWVRTRGFDRLATGHYARISEWRGKHWIAQAAAREKDQSYFLAAIESKVLPHLLFPIGDLPSKEAVRSMAKDARMEFLLTKAESMGLCFVGRRRNFQEFLNAFARPAPAQVIEEETGRLLREEYTDFVTLGQALKIGGLPGKLFCVGRREDTILASFNPKHKRLYPEKIHVRLPAEEVDEYGTRSSITCSIRSCDKEGTPLETITKIGTNLYQVQARTSFHAPAPGQYGVFYDKVSCSQFDELRIVIGCGEIVNNPCRGSESGPA